MPVDFVDDPAEHAFSPYLGLMGPFLKPLELSSADAARCPWTRSQSVSRAFESAQALIISQLEALARVQTPEVFVNEMAEYFEDLSWSRITGETSAVIGDVMELVRQHQARAR